MPRESFESASGETGFAVEWAPDGGYVIPSEYPDIKESTAVCIIGGTYVDEKNLDRLMAVLRRIKRKIANPVQSIRVGDVWYHCARCLDDNEEDPSHGGHRVETPLGEITWFSKLNLP